MIDITGQHVYPGFILPDTDLGLVEIRAVRATVDNAEEGSLNPNVRSLISYNTDSELIPTFRYNGILLAQITPQSGLIPGTSSVVQLDAWNWEDAAVATDNALHLHWPSRFRSEFDYTTYTSKRVANEKYEEQLRSVQTLFADAKVYAQAEQPQTANLKLDALRDLFNGTKVLYLHSNEAREILEAVLFAEKYGYPESCWWEVVAFCPSRISLKTGRFRWCWKTFISYPTTPTATWTCPTNWRTCFIKKAFW